MEMTLSKLTVFCLEDDGLIVATDVFLFSATTHQHIQLTCTGFKTALL